MQKKVEQLLRRLSEVEELLGNPDAYKDQKQYRALTQEHSNLSELKLAWEKVHSLKKQIEDNESLLSQESDPSFVEILKEDLTQLKAAVEEWEKKLEVLLVPPDPNDDRNTILELRAGTGGDEAALFVGDCTRMYKLYADKHGWRYEQLSCTPSERGGYKEFVMVLSGKNVYRYLKGEAGTHRVQRVPETEAQGRVHTSAITVAALLEPEENDDIVIDERDIRVDTYRSSGAGGQHVNTTDSAVRLTHVSGLVVYCQDERSQHKNKEKAMRLLKAKLAEEQLLKQQAEIASTRSSQVGSGDRSERIRTYNFPQNRITDHRINVTKYNLDQVMEGDLDDIIEPLVAHFHHQKLQGESQ